MTDTTKLAERIEALEGELAEAREALEPFAKASLAYPKPHRIVVYAKSKEWPNYNITSDDLTRARSVFLRAQEAHNG